MKKQRTIEEITAHLSFAKRYKDQLSNEIAQLEEKLKTLSPKPIKITQHIELEVKSDDEPEPMTWGDAMAKFGPDGTDKEWRLPTQFELAVMFQQKDVISQISVRAQLARQRFVVVSGMACGSYYWSSTEGNNYVAWAQRFSDGSQTYNFKSYYYLVRCVRR